MEGRPAVNLLVGVWGPSYIQGYLELSLRSLLAKGNLPALSAACDCTFTFLTTPADERRVRADPIFPALAACCAVRFVDISDLIMPGNVSTTLTLAYERGMRSTGAAMLRTYFIYLVADYIVADGSLAGLVPHLRRGEASGITSGNFQIVEEETRTELLARRSAEDGLLAIPPRELVRYALGHLHPVTVGSTVTQTEVHNAHANRLFWECGDGVLVGRFYLRHMICIRPETADFQVGSSCDYSFVPEMCPSGKVVALADSDEYLVVELQPARHENHFLRPGPLRPRALAADLSGWTTAEHRANVDTATVFHARDLDGEVGRVVAESQRTVDGIKPLLAPRPQPHRDHPYWKGAVRVGRNGLIGALQRRLVGVPPHVNRWHHSWQDYRPVMEHLEASTGRGRKVLAVHAAPNPCSFWLTRNYPQGSSFLHKETLVREPPRPGPRDVDVCYFFLDASQGADLPLGVERVLSMLAPRGEIVIHLMNDDGTSLFGVAASLSTRLRGGPIRLARTCYARSRFRARADAVRSSLVGATDPGRRPLRRMFSWLSLVPLQGAYRMDNELADLPLFGGGARASSCTLFLEMTP